MIPDSVQLVILRHIVAAVALLTLVFICYENVLTGSSSVRDFIQDSMVAGEKEEDNKSQLRVERNMNALVFGFTFDDHLAIEDNKDSWCPYHFSRWLSGDDLQDGDDTKKHTLLAMVWSDFLLGLSDKEEDHSGRSEVVVGRWESSYWLHDFWGRSIFAEQSHRSYRPLTVLTFRLNSCFDIWWWGESKDLSQEESRSRLRELRGAVAASSSSSEIGKPFVRSVDGGGTSFHVVNVAIHGVNTILIFVVLENFFHGFAGNSSVVGSSFASFFIAALFAVHPIHVEAVTSIVGRAEPLSTMYALMGLWIWELLGGLTEVELSQRKNEGDGREKKSAFFLVLGHGVGYALWFSCVVCACLAKDSGIITVGLCFAVDLVKVLALVKRSQQKEQQAEGETKKGKRHLTHISVLLGRFALCSAVGLLYLSARSYSMPSVDLKGSQLLRKAENPQAVIDDPLQRGVFLWYLNMKNIQLLFWPWPLCAEYSFNCVPNFNAVIPPALQDSSRLSPLVDTLRFVSQLGMAPVQDPRLGFALLGFVLLVAAGLFWGMNGLVQLASPTSPNFQYSFGMDDCLTDVQQRGLQTFLALTFMIVPLLPVSHVFVTVGTMLAERCLYLPSLGACMALVYLLFGTGEWLLYRSKVYYLLESKAKKQFPLSTTVQGILRTGRTTAASLVLTGLIFLVWIPLSLERSIEWRSDESLFESGIKVCSTSAKHHQQLAMLRLNQGRQSEARNLLIKANELDPEFCEPRWHLARISINETKYEEAVDHLKHCSSCPWVAAQCFSAYQQVKMLLQREQSRTKSKQELGEDYAAKTKEISDIMLKMVENSKSLKQSELRPTLSTAANQLRQSGLAQRQLHDDPCSAVSLFEQSATLRKRIGLLGALSTFRDAEMKGKGQEETGEDDTDDNYPNTVFWQVYSLTECYLKAVSDEKTRRSVERLISANPAIKLGDKENPLSRHFVSAQMYFAQASAEQEITPEGGIKRKQDLLSHLSLASLVGLLDVLQQAAHRLLQPHQQEPSSTTSSTPEGMGYAQEGSIVHDASEGQYLKVAQTVVTLILQRLQPKRNDGQQHGVSSTFARIEAKVDDVLTSLPSSFKVGGFDSTAGKEKAVLITPGLDSFQQIWRVLASFARNLNSLRGSKLKSDKEQQLTYDGKDRDALLEFIVPFLVSQGGRAFHHRSSSRKATKGDRVDALLSMFHFVFSSEMEGLTVTRSLVENKQQGSGKEKSRAKTTAQQRREQQESKEQKFSLSLFLRCDLGSAIVNLPKGRGGAKKWEEEKDPFLEYGPHLTRLFAPFQPKTFSSLGLLQDFLRSRFSDNCPHLAHED